MTVSVIVYGRNDSHGYNLHKRAAISLNCIAEVLTAPGDEILFVDYNSADDLPTFPEAIQDTLTERAKTRLRVLRVRPAAHARFAAGTHLPVLEPIARNVALRRSNRDNRWVLSTNTDMIFTPQDGGSLSELVAGLDDGFYHLPRFELPEGLWETFVRYDPQATLAAVREAGRALHLRQVVRGSPTILYDAPGDFQLCLREDLFAIDGFDEEMILGWHVDSNLAKRLGLHRGPIRSLEGRLEGYHCDHTRQATLVHTLAGPQNDSDRFVDSVTVAGLSAQARTWGLTDAAVETFALINSPSARYGAAVRAAIGAPQIEPVQAEYAGASFNRIAYDWRTALPFLVDAVAANGDIVIGYVGVTPDLLCAFAQALAALTPGTRILVTGDAPSATTTGNVVDAEAAAWRDQPDMFVFEIGASPGGDPVADGLKSGEVITRFQAIAEARAAGASTRIVAVNAVNTEFEAVLNRYAVCAPAPYGARVRQGILRPAGAADGPAQPLRRWTDRFMAGSDGQWAWERASILDALEQTIAGRGLARPRVLLACHLAEPLAHMLVSLGLETDFVDPLSLIGDAEGRDWRGDLAEIAALIAEPIGALRDDGCYDAVVCPQGALLIRGWARAGAIFAELDQRLAPEGTFVFSLDEARELGRRRDVLPSAFAAASEYELVRIDHRGAEGDPDAASVWTWRKPTGGIVAADLVSEAFRPRPDGDPADVTRRMHAKEWVTVTDAGWSIPRASPTGHALYGPYVALAQGRYRATLGASARQPQGRGSVLRLEVAFGADNIVASRDITVSDLERGPVTLDFDAPEPGSGLAEVRIVHFGRADLLVETVTLGARDVR